MIASLLILTAALATGGLILTTLAAGPHRSQAAGGEFAGIEELPWVALLGISMLAGVTVLVLTSSFKTCLAAASLPTLTSLTVRGLTGSSAKKRRLLVRRELPVLLDFLVMQVESGHSILQALHSAVALFSQRSPVRKGLEELAESIRVGCSVDEALGQLNLFLDTPESESPITAISLALKHGSPLGKVLRNQSARLRERLIIEGEKFASTLPVKMLVPLLFFMFPASFLVIFSPVLVSLLENLP